MTKARAGLTPHTLLAHQQIRNAALIWGPVYKGLYSTEMRQGEDTLWLVIRKGNEGGIALRANSPGGELALIAQQNMGSTARWVAENICGRYEVEFSISEAGLVRLAVALTPATDLLIPFWPRDLYPLDAEGNPAGTRGCVEAAQRGMNTGVCFLRLDQPAFGTVLYLQDLTALNSFFKTVETKPDGVVGGEWPELGYQPPASPLGPAPPKHPLKKGVRVEISRGFLRCTPTLSDDEVDLAREFVDGLAAIYPSLVKPSCDDHDWRERAERTLRDLFESPEATIEHYGHRYIHPYTAAEYPDCMVQMAVTSSLHRYEKIVGGDMAPVETLFAGMEKFYDDELQTLRRYLPNVGEDKDRDAVDSWYMYHPLLRLGRMAIGGHAGAEDLFLRSLPHALRAAHHFKYKWPIQFNIRNFSVITPSRNAEGYGQTDVGGVYAYVMLQAYELTQEERYLDEAKAALAALEDLRFELVYQTNLTAWGATACAMLWRRENDPRWLDQSQVFIAGFLHNCRMWKSEIGHAENYASFLGATCLHDAAYMSAYECYESIEAFEEYLRLTGENASPAARLLLSEYIRFGFDRGWNFYPDTLPEDAIAKDEIRNGHIDRALSFPLEDLYGDEQPVGQVGQEIYGCGGAFVFAAILHERAQAGEEPEVLADGQEEVFSRTEVELGRIEHEGA